MAAPATHIVLAEKLYQKYFSNKDKPSYIIGTSFPDIRYLGVIDREKTHFKDIKILNIIDESSFNAGLKLHSLVDEVREKFMTGEGLYDLFPESQLLTQGVKFFEDRVLYDRIGDWNRILSYFDTVFPEELNYGVSNENVIRWHSYLKSTLSHKPKDEDLKIFVAEIGKPVQIADEIARVVNGVKDQKRAEEIINEFIDSFELLIPA